jgi:NADH-quinone oxidoreductase subunit L
VVLRPCARLARAFSWFDGRILDGLVNAVGAVTRVFANLDGAIDKYLVDGAVNAVASAVQAVGGTLRHLQTGRIQTYLYGALGGALVVVLVNFLIS